MKQEQFIKKMEQHKHKFDDLWMEIVRDVNDYVKDNPQSSMNDFQNNVEQLNDTLCLSGAWVHDRLNGKTGNPNSAKYRGSLTKKIRKALGYNI